MPNTVYLFIYLENTVVPLPSKHVDTGTCLIHFTQDCDLMDPSCYILRFFTQNSSAEWSIELRAFALLTDKLVTVFLQVFEMAKNDFNSF